ncbi:sugar phosphate isomerase/epimerase family protein [Neobacillus sp. GCM10023253]|uniref:sugar phosphate isomerase/epimerase family protein n=1 Tax=Neobacillus sp. GCM10023253 TaxID=3252644 RepID=UPI00361CC946
MQNVIVPLNAFDRSKVLERGQAAFVGLIAEAGAYGIEIRRELMPEPDSSFDITENRQKLAPIQCSQFSRIKQEIDRHGLFTVYSAPIELWKADYQLNEEELTTVFQEGRMLGAKWLKVSLGHFSEEHSDFSGLRDFLKRHQEIQLLVENDQTLHGGYVHHLFSFFENADRWVIPVKMTFDAGNWYYTNQDVEEALQELSPYVVYLHLKQVETQNGELVTIPLQKEGTHTWKMVLNHFPQDIVKALEFSIEPKERIREFMELVGEEALLCHSS